MGATNIEFEVEGDKPFQEVLAAFKRRQAQDSDDNGHQDGYSGDFQTVHSVENHGHKVFTDYQEAQKYCLDNAEKWESVIAVKYKVTDKIKVPKSFQKLSGKLRMLQGKYSELLKEIETNFLKDATSKNFVACRHCQSKIATDHLRGTACRVCGENMVSKSSMNKLANLLKKVGETDRKINTIANELKKKAAEKSNKTQWLIAGWGAC